VDSPEALPLPTNSCFVQNSESNTIVNIEDNDPPSKNKNDVSREDLLLEIFQKNISGETLNFVKEVEKNPSRIHCLQSEASAMSKVFQCKESREKSHNFMTNVRLNKEVKLIRIFPGPAGLVSDLKNDNISAASYLSSVKEFENKKSTKHIEIKSQDEKNLCGEKAWKLLLNDLPNNFLQDYKISTVKDKANASHCDSMKVKFIAGVLDYVDHSHDDPFVILKDSTGSIEGTIHRDIPLTYPGILEPNVVIFLCDVGLLKTTTYVITNKYHILVSLVNLLAIYSAKGRIVSTSLMEDILSHTSKIKLNKINSRLPISKKPVYISELQKMDESCNTSLQTNNLTIDSSIKNHESELTKNSLVHLINESCGKTLKNDKSCKVTNKTLGCFNSSMNDSTDDLNMDVFFTTDCDLTILEEQNCLDHLLFKSISQTSQIQQCDLQNMEHSKNMEKKSMINFQKQTKERHLPQTLQKCNDVKTCDVHYSRENCFSSNNDTICRDSNLNVKLSAMKRNVENSKTLVSYFADDNHDAYDSDDEILSQLDVDNIFDKSKKDC